VLKNGLTDEELGELTGEQIDILLQQMSNICILSYTEKTAASDLFRQRYLSPCLAGL
jgi:hypothetical protein